MNEIINRLITIIMKYVFIITMIFSILLSIPKEVEAREKIAGSSSQLERNVIVSVDDIRVTKLTRYLESHNSPLASNADYFVKTADKYGFGENWSLVAAIAGVESTFGKHTPKNSYNAWGWGIPTGSQSGIGFDSWEDGIETVSSGLQTRYMDKGADSIEKIGRIYAPPSTTWAKNVRFFMNKIEETEPSSDELALSL